MRVYVRYVIKLTLLFTTHANANSIVLWIEKDFLSNEIKFIKISFLQCESFFYVVNSHHIMFNSHSFLSFVHFLASLDRLFHLHRRFGIGFVFVNCIESLCMSNSERFVRTTWRRWIRGLKHIFFFVYNMYSMYELSCTNRCRNEVVSMQYILRMTFKMGWKGTDRPQCLGHGRVGIYITIIMIDLKVNQRNEREMRSLSVLWLHSIEMCSHTHTHRQSNENSGQFFASKYFQSS